MASRADLLDHKRYDRNFGLFDSVFHEVRDAILIISTPTDTPHPIIEDVNHQFELITGYSLDTIKNTNLFDYFDDRLLESRRNSISDALRQGQAAIFFCNWKCRSGDLLDVDMTLRPFHGDADRPRFLCVLRESRSEKNFRDEAARDIKKKLLAAMHHNFRTPLNGILGYSEIIMTEMLGPVGKDAYRDYAKDIHEAGQNLLMLIDNLLDLKELETTEFELREETFSLTSLLQSCLDGMAEDARKAGVSLVCAIDVSLPHFFGDLERLSKVIYSLLENALKFTAPGGRITLGAEMETDGSCLITCTDNGSGMTAQQVAKAFSHDSHLADIYSNPTTGIGFGLAYVKKLIERHDGTVSIASTTGEGTTVYLHLPASRISSPS
tara:strand:+ start:459 stop:1601 length:1143 start_codon:yes stop_codon:yes gene_type:complete